MQAGGQVGGLALLLGFYDHLAKLLLGLFQPDIDHPNLTRGQLQGIAVRLKADERDAQQIAPRTQPRHYIEPVVVGRGTEGRAGGVFKDYIDTLKRLSIRRLGYKTSDGGGLCQRRRHEAAPQPCSQQEHEHIKCDRLLHIHATREKSRTRRLRPILRRAYRVRMLFICRTHGALRSSPAKPKQRAASKTGNYKHRWRASPRPYAFLDEKKHRHAASVLPAL